MKHNYLILGLLSLALAACSGGENGIDGKDGKDGGSCHVADNGDGSATITCPDGTSFTIKNGENGQSCKLVENIDGSAAVVCPYDGTSYIVRGNTDNYANYCVPGFYGKNCENECPVCGEHSKCNDGVTGDGSCICLDGWSDEDCSVCPAGFYDGVTDCFDCRKGSTAFGTEKCTLSDKRTDPATIYRVVTIGNQTWMAENMRYQTGTFYHANNSYSNDVAYGLLYDWWTAKTVCSSGWRLPKQSEFQNLLTNIGTATDLSRIRDSSWLNGSDSSGFGALPAGFRSDNGSFGNFGSSAGFWSATPDVSDYAYILFVDSGRAYVGSSYVDFAFSVRCLKD